MVDTAPQSFHRLNAKPSSTLLANEEPVLIHQQDSTFCPMPAMAQEFSLLNDPFANELPAKTRLVPKQLKEHWSKLRQPRHHVPRDEPSPLLCTARFSRRRHRHRRGIQSTVDEAALQSYLAQMQNPSSALDPRSKTNNETRPSSVHRGFCRPLLPRPWTGSNGKFSRSAATDRPQRRDGSSAEATTQTVFRHPSSITSTPSPTRRVRIAKRLRNKGPRMLMSKTPRDVTSHTEASPSAVDDSPAPAESTVPSLPDFSRLRQLPLERTVDSSDASPSRLSSRDRIDGASSSDAGTFRAPTTLSARLVQPEPPARTSSRNATRVSMLAVLAKTNDTDTSNRCQTITKSPELVDAVNSAGGNTSKSCLDAGQYTPYDRGGEANRGVRLSPATILQNQFGSGPHPAIVRQLREKTAFIVSVPHEDGLLTDVSSDHLGQRIDSTAETVERSPPRQLQIESPFRILSIKDSGSPLNESFDRQMNAQRQVENSRSAGGRYQDVRTSNGSGRKDNDTLAELATGAPIGPDRADGRPLSAERINTAPRSDLSNLGSISRRPTDRSAGVSDTKVVKDREPEFETVSLVRHGRHAKSNSDAAGSTTYYRRGSIISRQNSATNQSSQRDTLSSTESVGNTSVMKRYDLFPQAYSSKTGPHVSSCAASDSKIGRRHTASPERIASHTMEGLRRHMHRTDRASVSSSNSMANSHSMTDRTSSCSPVRHPVGLHIPDRDLTGFSVGDHGPQSLIKEDLDRSSADATRARNWVSGLDDRTPESTMPGSVETTPQAEAHTTRSSSKHHNTKHHRERDDCHTRLDNDSDDTVERLPTRTDSSRSFLYSQEKDHGGSQSHVVDRDSARVDAARTRNSHTTTVDGGERNNTLVKEKPSTTHMSTKTSKTTVSSSSSKSTSFRTSADTTTTTSLSAIKDEFRELVRIVDEKLHEMTQYERRVRQVTDDLAKTSMLYDSLVRLQLETQLDHHSQLQPRPVPPSSSTRQRDTIVLSSSSHSNLNLDLDRSDQFHRNRDRSVRSGHNQANTIGNHNQANAVGDHNHPDVSERRNRTGAVRTRNDNAPHHERNRMREYERRGGKVEGGIDDDDDDEDEDEDEDEGIKKNNDRNQDRNEDGEDCESLIAVSTTATTTSTSTTTSESTQVVTHRRTHRRRYRTGLIVDGLELYYRKQQLSMNVNMNVNMNTNMNMRYQ